MGWEETLLLGDSNTKCHQFIAESQTTGKDWTRTNRRRLKASSGEVMEHVPGLGLKHDKTLSFGTQELHTAQKRRSGLLTVCMGGKRRSPRAVEGLGQCWP